MAETGKRLVDPGAPPGAPGIPENSKAAVDIGRCSGNFR
jgi:hypothetical protein